MSDPIETAIRIYRLDPLGVHGFKHWANVWHRGMSIGMIEGANWKVISHFAYLHDVMRMDENYDPNHGPLAADYVAAGEWNLDSDELELLVTAIRGHADGRTSTDPTIGSCWDADRLDLPRVGITPKIQYMSTDTAKRLVEQAHG